MRSILEPPVLLKVDPPLNNYIEQFELWLANRVSLGNFTFDNFGVREKRFFDF